MHGRKANTSPVYSFQPYISYYIYFSNLWIHPGFFACFNQFFYLKIAMILLKSFKHIEYHNKKKIRVISHHATFVAVVTALLATLTQMFSHVYYCSLSVYGSRCHLSMIEWMYCLYYHRMKNGQCRLFKKNHSKNSANNFLKLLPYSINMRISNLT